MVITKTIEGSNCLGGVFFSVVVNKGKALRISFNWRSIQLKPKSRCKISLLDTLHCPVILSLARKILAMCPKGLNSSWRK